MAEAGAITANGNGGSEIKVEISENDPQKCVVTAKEEGGRLVLKAEGVTLPVEKNWKNLYGLGQKQGRKLDCPAAFKIQAPKAAILDIEAASGAVAAEGFDSDIKIENASGDISLRRLTGSVSVTAASGRVSGELCAKSVKLDTASGKTSLTGLCGPLAAEAAAGGLDLEWARVPASGQVSIQSGAGSIRLVFPRAAKLSASLVSPGGKIKNEFENTGGFPVSVESGASDISLLKSAGK